MSVYKRGNKYWYHFVFNGVHVQASTKVANRNDARDIERARWNQLARHEVGLPTHGAKKNPTIGELMTALEDDFKLRGKWDVRNQSNFKLARAAFPATMKATSLANADVDSFITKKQREAYAPATINRILLLVGQAYKKGIERGDIERAPKFRHLSEQGNARQGFFEGDEFARLLEHLPEDLKDFCRFAYATGWRKAEISLLKWSDIEGDIVRLRGENAKNAEPRSVVLVGELAEIIGRRRDARYVRGVLTHSVFHRAGTPVAEFRKSWSRACVKAKLGAMVCSKCGEEGETQKCGMCKVRRIYSGKIFHDFRRTAVRDMIRSGVPQSIAMKISGHKTASMFRRYDIASEDDLRAAMQSVDRYHQAAQQKIVSIAK